MTESQAWVAIAWLTTIAILVGPAWHAVVTFAVVLAVMVATLWVFARLGR